MLLAGELQGTEATSDPKGGLGPFLGEGVVWVEGLYGQIEDVVPRSTS